MADAVKMGYPDMSSDNAYNLKWTNHKNNVVQMFIEHLHKEWLVDVTLSCEGQFIKAHKMILSACSPYFQELFNVHRVDHPLIIMNEMKYDMLLQIIDFMYEGEVKVSNENFESLLIIAEKLQIKGLSRLRQEYEAKKEKDVKEEDVTGDVESSPAYKSNTPTESNPNHVEVEVDTNTSITNSKYRKRRKQVHSAIVNQSVEGSPSESLLAAAHSPDPDAKLARQDDGGLERPNHKIPRPPNAFMIFANEWRKKLALEHQGDSNKEISVRLGSMWKSLSSSTKSAYYLAAKKADEEHKIKYPGYYYSPKEARLRKEMRGNGSSKTPTVLINSAGCVSDIDSSLVTVLMPDTTDDHEMISSEEIKEEPGSSPTEIMGSDHFSSESNGSNSPMQ